MLPFTRDQFVAIFAEYNEAVWPVQVVAYALGFVMIVMLVGSSRLRDRTIAVGLAVMWLWTGIAYHALFFSAVNTAAFLFAALFIIQGGLFAYFAVRGPLQFGLRPGLTVWVGAAFALYAAVVYPLLGMWFGHPYPEMPMFGITPCPVTILTFAFLLLTTGPVPLWLTVIPLTWSLIGGSAAFLLGVPQDWVLLATGVIAIPLIALHDRQGRHVVRVA